MPTSSCLRGKVKEKLDKFFDKSVIEELAVFCGFARRKPRKISPYHFVLGFIMSCCKKQNSFSSWAQQIGLLSGESVSKQGVFDRIHSGATAFAKALLQHVLLQQSKSHFATELFSSFGKVLLQDSTTFRLPQILSSIFPGNRSRGEQKAVARIQSIIDIKAIKFLDLVLGAFTQNDQSASGSVLAWVRKGDLVIRDLGYFAIDTFEKFIKAEVHFLSRLKYGVNIYDLQGRPIPLKQLLKQGKRVDRWVLIGHKNQISVRLVMIPLAAQYAAEKIRKAKNDRDRRLNHSKEYYQWLGFSIYITTVEDACWNTAEVAKAYSVRWQIEIIFKSWKSGFYMQHILHEGYTNEDRVKVSIYLLLLFMCLFIQKIYVRYKNNIEKNTDRKISLLKMTVFVCNNINQLFSISSTHLIELIVQHCCYEKRNDRINMTDLYQNNQC
jgi:hypothetical protein